MRTYLLSFLLVALLGIAGFKLWNHLHAPPPPPPKIDHSAEIAFASAAQLTSTSLGSPRMAILNGRSLAEGDVVQLPNTQLLVTRIEDRQVTLQGRDQTVYTVAIRLPPGELPIPNRPAPVVVPPLAPQQTATPAPSPQQRNAPSPTELRQQQIARLEQAKETYQKIYDKSKSPTGDTPTDWNRYLEAQVNDLRQRVNALNGGLDDPGPDPTLAYHRYPHLPPIPPALQIP